MFQRTMNELKAIALELGAKPVGDCRKIQTWKQAIEHQAQSMGISVEAAYCSILRASELVAQNIPGVDRAQDAVEVQVTQPVELEEVELEIRRFDAVEVQVTQFVELEEVELEIRRFDAVEVQVTEPVEFEEAELEIRRLDLTEHFAGFFSVGTVETVLLESMCQWASCELLLEAVPAVESFCFCGEVLASQCDGRTVTVRVYPNRVVRVPCYKNRVGCCSRSPPGGGAVT